MHVEFRRSSRHPGAIGAVDEAAFGLEAEGLFAGPRDAELLMREFPEVDIVVAALLATHVREEALRAVMYLLPLIFNVENLHIFTGHIVEVPLGQVFFVSSVV